MKKLLVFAFLLFSLGTFARTAGGLSQSRDSLMDLMYLAGLPGDAVPVKHFFSSIDEYGAISPAYRQFTVDDLQESMLSDGMQDRDTCYFFARLRYMSGEEDMDTPLDLWVYDNAAGRAWQFLTWADTMDIYNVAWNYSITSADSLFTNPGTGQTFRLLKKESAPVAVVCTTDNGHTVHQPYNTIIVNLRTGRTKTLRGHKFISFLEPQETALMAAENGLSKRYILTTVSRWDDEEMQVREPVLPDGYDGPFVSMYYRNYITPVVEVWTMEGEYAGSITLPKDRIDCVR